MYPFVEKYNTKKDRKYNLIDEWLVYQYLTQIVQSPAIATNKVTYIHHHDFVNHLG